MMGPIDYQIQALYAPEAAQALSGAMADDTLADMDFSSVDALAKTASLRSGPDVSPAAFRESVMSQYFNDVVLGAMSAGLNRTSAREEALDAFRRESMLGSLSDDERQMLARDVALGDSSSLLRLEENYCFR